MFQSPWFIGLASVIPGLGYVFLKKWKALFITWFLLIASLVLLLESRSDSVLEEISGQLFWGTWIVQGFIAFYAAKREKSLAAGEVEKAKTVKGSEIIVPIDVPRRKRGYYKLEQMLLAQLEMGDQLKASAFGIDSAQARVGATQYMLGLTAKDFVALNFDFFGKPSTFIRRPLIEVERVDYKKRLIQDKFFVHFIDSKKPLKLFVSFAFRQEANDFIATLASLKHVNEEASF